MGWTIQTYPLDRMVKELTEDPRSEYYPEDLEDLTEQQIRDLYADFYEERG